MRELIGPIYRKMAGVYVRDLFLQRDAGDWTGNMRDSLANRMDIQYCGYDSTFMVVFF